ncbi:MAG: TIGR00730 family Rossman fold protein [Gammaproteobacteria bacterium]|nr:TIGR00730 family Rossman fold protein [Gammaproteobacteria bacterium]
MKRICVYCGHSEGHSPEFTTAAKTVGTALAERGIGLVYGAGGKGMMGAVADGAIEGGGEVIGVIPEGIFSREGLHTGVTRLEVTPNMHGRKRMMAELANGFLALPGGLGTMDELFEIWTWTQLGVHNKPTGILNVNGYYDGLLTFIDVMVDNGFLQQAIRDAVLVGADVNGLLDQVIAHRPGVHPRWANGD